MAISQKVERMVQDGEVWRIEKPEGGEYRAWWDAANGFQLMELDGQEKPVDKQTTPDGDGAAETFAAAMRSLAPLNEWSLYPHEPGHTGAVIPFAEPDGLEDDIDPYEESDNAILERGYAEYDDPDWNELEDDLDAELDEDD